MSALWEARDRTSVNSVNQKEAWENLSGISMETSGKAVKSFIGSYKSLANFPLTLSKFLSEQYYAWGFKSGLKRHAWTGIMIKLGQVSNDSQAVLQSKAAYRRRKRANRKQRERMVTKAKPSASRYPGLDYDMVKGIESDDDSLPRISLIGTGISNVKRKEPVFIPATPIATSSKQKASLDFIDEKMAAWRLDFELRQRQRRENFINGKEIIAEQDIDDELLTLSCNNQTFVSRCGVFANRVLQSWQTDVELTSASGEFDSDQRDLDEFNRFVDQSPMTVLETMYSNSCGEGLFEVVVEENLRNSTINKDVREKFSPSAFRSTKVVLQKFNLSNLAVKTLEKALIGQSQLLRWTNTIINVVLNIATFGIYGIVNQVIETIPAAYQFLTGVRTKVADFCRSPRQMIRDFLTKTLMNTMSSSELSLLTRTSLRDRVTATLPATEEENESDEHKLTRLLVSVSMIDMIRLVRFRWDVEARREFRMNCNRIIQRADEPYLLELIKRVVFLTTYSAAWAGRFWRNSLLGILSMEGYVEMRFPHDSVESEFNRYLNTRRRIAGESYDDLTDLERETAAYYADLLERSTRKSS